MRNTFIVLTLVISVLLPGKALATGIDFQVKNVTVREAVLKLQQQYGFSVTVESNEVDMNRKVSVSAKNESISTILSHIFTGQNVTYTVTNKSIVIQSRKQPTGNTPATQRPRLITGRVINGADKEPLIGVTVQNPESGKGVITNVNGDYSIEAIPGQTLKFSYVGFSDI